MNFRRLILGLTLPLYLLDQATKFWTVHHFDPPWISPGAKIAILENAIHWMRVHNQGVAFGFGNGSAWAPIVFMIVPLAALALLRIFWKKGAFHHPLAQVALALLIAGIFGNLTDRLVQGFLLEDAAALPFWQRLSEGYVVDFIAIKLPYYDRLVPSSGGWWPAFNVADSCICVAASLLMLSSFFEDSAAKRADTQQSTERPPDDSPKQA